nr:immunoglobulin light chain junction region [Macaca mulatta]
CQQYNSDLYSF